MSRDSILDEAEQKTEQTNNSETSSAESTDDQDDGGNEERTRLTQRIPDDLLADVERVQEKHHLPSRNAAINFMLTRAADELLDDPDQ